MQISVKSNIKEFTKNLNLFQKSQIPFATSRALNDTAIKGQESTVKKVQITFNNRKKWYNKSNRKTGIRVNFSNKNKLPITASIYTNAYFLGLHEKGGIKRPVSGSSIAVPTNKAPNTLRRSDGVSRAKTRKNVFVSSKGVFQRMARRKIKPLFTWARIANIRPQLGFERTNQVSVKRWFPIFFRKRIEQAIKTAKL